MRTHFYLLFLLLPLASCATLTAENTQPVSISTTPPGAQCTLRNDVGQWNIPATPDVAEVARSFSPLQVQCHKQGAGAASITLESSTRARAFGNILLGGVPAVVDAGTGAGYEYSPANANLNLTRE